MAFKPATRNAVKLKLGLMGPSGSGKTFSALRLAKGLVPGGKICFLDTENGSASLYADRFGFDVDNMAEPCTVDKFKAGVLDAIKCGYDLIIIDSISSEWTQLLAEKEMLDSRGGNSFTNWASITKKHEEFKKSFLLAPIHIIACMRSKQEYVLQQNDKGKQAPVKVGMGAIQREGFEYECSVVFDIDMQHNAKASKDRSSLFGDEIFQITEATGLKLLDWLQKGGAPVPEENSGVIDAEVVPNPHPTLTSPTQTPSTALRTTPRTQPTSTIEPKEEDPAWIEAMVELAAVTVGMPEMTRKKLVSGFEADGPAALPALLAEIASIKSVLNPEAPAPTTVGGAINQLPQAAKARVSQAAETFVNSVDPDTDEQNGGISPEQYQALGLLIGAYKINRDALRAYCAKAGHLLPATGGRPTLARMKETYFTQLRTKLLNNKIASNNETWSARTIRLINETPTTAYSPLPAVS